MSKRIGSAPGRRSVGTRRGRRPAGRAVEALEPRVVLATFTVTSAADLGAGSLRDAIEQANRSGEADVIEIAPAVSGPIVLSGPLPTLTGELKINGPVDSRVVVARDGRPETPEFRIFTVAEGAQVEFRQLTITGGRSDLGGGIRNDGELRIVFCDVVGNFAHFKGGGVYNTGRFIAAVGSIRDNVAEGAQTLGFGPTAVGRGGGVYSSGVLVVSTATVANNRANREGGGIWNDDVLIMDTSTVAGNVAEGFALAPGRVPVGRGGGIFSTYLAQIDGSTIAGNAANLEGGGLFSDVRRPRIEKGVRIDDSYIQSTIVADNANGDVVVVSGPSVSRGNFVSRGNNLVGDLSGAAAGPFDVIGVVPLLAPLGDYLGEAPTRPPMPGSPAIDAGRFDEKFSRDQRGELRKDGTTDIGAVEAYEVELGLVSGDAQASPVGQPFAEPLVVALDQFDFDTVPVAGSPVVFTAPAEGPSAVLVGNPGTIGEDDRAQVRAIANGIPGTYTVVARLNGAKEPVEFTLTNVGTAPSPATASQAIARSARDLVEDAAAAIPRPSRFDPPRRAVAGALASASRATGRASATSSAWLARSADRLPPRLARWLGRDDQPTARNGASSRPGTPISTSWTPPV